MAKTNRRQKGEGSIFQRGSDGRWVARTYEGSKDGRPRDFYGATPDEAMGKRQAYLDDIREGFNKPKNLRMKKFGEWLDEWLAGAHHLERKTRDGFASKIKVHIKPALGHIPLDELEEEDIERFYASLKRKGSAPSTIVQIHRICSRAMKIAARRRKYVKRNVFESVEPPKLERAEITPPEDDEAPLILDAVKDRRNGVRWDLNLVFGPRQGEALGLMWDYVDLADLDNASVEIQWELQRNTWHHGCDDPHACGFTTGKHNYPCPKNCKQHRHRPDCVEGCTKRGHNCPVFCKKRAKGGPPCAKHTHEPSCTRSCGKVAHRCRTACPPGCTGHATVCPQRIEGGLVIKRPKSESSRRKVYIPRWVAERLLAHKLAQDIELTSAGPAWSGWHHDREKCDRRPKPRERVCPKCERPTKKNSLVFTQPNGRPIDPRRDWQEWADLLEELQLPHYRVHDGRHYAATNLLDADVDITVVTAIIGHSSTFFTQNTYQHVSRRLQQDAMRKASERIGRDTDSDTVDRA